VVASRSRIIYDAGDGGGSVTGLGGSAEPFLHCEARLRAIDADLDKVWLRIDGLEKEITRLSMEV
jgi:hypothetical protein